MHVADCIVGVHHGGTHTSNPMDPTEPMVPCAGRFRAESFLPNAESNKPEKRLGDHDGAGESHLQWQVPKRLGKRIREEVAADMCRGIHGSKPGKVLGNLQAQHDVELKSLGADEWQPQAVAC